MSGNKESMAEESSSSAACGSATSSSIRIFVWFGEYYLQHCFFTGSIEVPEPFQTELELQSEYFRYWTVCFNSEQQQNSFRDYIEASVMLQYNKQWHCEIVSRRFLTLMSIILSSIIGKNAKHNRWYLRELEHRIIGKIRSILCMSLGRVWIC